jgi:hypothetical protein
MTVAAIGVGVMVACAYLFGVHRGYRAAARDHRTAKLSSSHAERASAELRLAYYTRGFQPTRRAPREEGEER